MPSIPPVLAESLHLKGASFGYDYDSGNAHSVLYNHHRSSLNFYGDSAVPVYYSPKKFSEFVRHSYDFSLIAGGDDSNEGALWGLYKKMRQHEAEKGDYRSSCLRLGFQAQIIQQAFLSIPKETWFTCLSIAKLITLSLLFSNSPSSGTILGCGTYRGGSAIFFRHQLRLLGQNNTLHAFDTFAGIPAAQSQDENTPWTSGQFTDTSVDSVRGYVEKNGLQSVVKLHPGLINTTVPEFIRSSSEVAFAFLDTDQYVSTKSCLEVIIPKLKTNGHIVIDDAVDPGVAVAIREIHQDNPALRGFYPIHNMYVLFNKVNSKLNTFACCE